MSTFAMFLKQQQEKICAATIATYKALPKKQKEKLSVAADRYNRVAHKGRRVRKSNAYAKFVAQQLEQDPTRFGKMTWKERFGEVGKMWRAARAPSS